MEDYVKGPAPDRWQWTKNYSKFPRWHWREICKQYPVKISQRRSTRPNSELCEECLTIEKHDQILRELSHHKEVKEIMSPNVVTITPEASMATAAQIMGEKHIGSLIVLKYNVPVGIVTERDMISKVLAMEKNLKDIKVETVMSYPLSMISPTAKIKEAAQMMIQKKERLVVIDCGKLVGIVTTSDLIRSLPEVPETEPEVDNLMTQQVETTDEETPVESVAKLMGEKGIGSVIITRQGDPFGIFTERDLLNILLLESMPLKSKVGKEASTPLITIPVGTNVAEAAVTMAMKHIRRLPIMKNGEMVGIITARDLVEAYAK